MEVFSQLRYALWGPFTIVFMLATGIYLTIESRFVQLWGLPYLFRNRKKTQSNGLTPWQALCTSLGGTLGVGNMAGVAIAITLGGPGAVFYMLLAAFFGMATKYAELLLAVHYQIPGPAPLGGPMVYLKSGANMPIFAKVFAIFCVFSAFGTGAAAQGGAITEAVQTVLPLSPVSIGLGTAALLLPILHSGGACIAKVSTMLVPVMTVLYLVSGGCILLLHRDAIPQAFHMIWQDALHPQAASGGIVGLLTAHTVADGFAKGVFSNEAGMGSAPIAHGCTAGAKPCDEGLLGAVEVFLDTFVVCLMTALVLLVTDAAQSGTQGLALTEAAFSTLFGDFTGIFIAVMVIFLAVSTVLGWSFYGITCLRWLCVPQLLQRLYPFGIAFSIVLATQFPLTDLLTLCDIAAALMAFPNLYGLWRLAPVVRAETTKFLQNR